MSGIAIRTATAADFQGILNLLIAAFSENQPAHAPFDQLYPETIRPVPHILDNWYIAVSEGKLVASTEIVPQRFAVAPGVEVRVGGIGQVSCLPGFRGQGLMTELLNATIKRMARDGYHVSILGGDRLRYGRFGWEVAGCVRSLYLHNRRVTGNPLLPAEDNRPTRWIGDEKVADQIHQAHQKNISRLIRSREETHLALQRLNIATWVHKTNEGFAYLCLSGNAIVEYGGDAAAFEQLLSYLLARRSVSVTIPAAEGSGPLEAIMLEFAANFSQQPVDMIRIFSLLSILEAYRPILQQRLASWEGKIVLELADPDAGEKIQLSRDVSGLKIAPTSAPADLTLDRRNWAPMLFGPFAPAAAADARTLAFTRQAFNLPIVWPPMSQI